MDQLLYVVLEDNQQHASIETKEKRTKEIILLVEIRRRAESLVLCRNMRLCIFVRHALQNCSNL